MDNITKKQQLLNDCKEAMGKDNAGITLFIKMPTGEEEMIHNPNIAAKMAYIEKAYDEELRLKSCQDIQIVEHHVHFPEDEVMDFGVALMNLKEGHRVARKGWNGKNQYLELAERISYMNAAGEVIDCEHEAIGNKAIAFVGTSGVQMGWLASQADMLAEDWIIL